jgi:hypothetical protein
MTPDQTSQFLQALLEATAERFAKLPLEAEPSNFQAEQRRNSP